MCDACNFAIQGLQLQEKASRIGETLKKLYVIMSEAVIAGNTGLEKETVDSALVLYKDMVTLTNDSIRMKSLFDAQIEVCIIAEKFQLIMDC